MIEVYHRQRKIIVIRIINAMHTQNNKLLELSYSLVFKESLHMMKTLVSENNLLTYLIHRFG